MIKRNYGIDLLKIISMFMIVILHVLGRGGILYNLGFITKRYVIFWLVEITCFVSVNCYGMITGYLMVDKEVKFKNLFKLWIEVVFWLLFIAFCLWLLGYVGLCKKDIIMFLFPIFNDIYWYFSAYFCLFFFMPFINKVIKNISKNNYRKLLLVIIVLFSVLEVNEGPFMVGSGYSFLWLLCLYLIGAYTRLYGLRILKKCNYLFMLLLLIPLLFKIVVSYYPDTLGYFFSTDMFISYNSIFILVPSIILLYKTINIKVNNKYIINLLKRLSKATFGVYIIHLHPYIWDMLKDRFVNYINYPLLELLVIVFFSSFMIYMLCSYMELFRLFIFNKLKINTLVDGIYIFVSENLQKSFLKNSK